MNIEKSAVQLIALPAFTDNYIWMLAGSQRCLVVDPGDAQVVLDALSAMSVTLDTIFVTHHHPDHTGGVAALREATGCKVFGPERETMPEPICRLGGGDTVQAMGLTFAVIDVPGHTAGHIAYYCFDTAVCQDTSPLLFCGDTLFSGGCGRLFEGTPAQMLASLDTLAALPGNTRVCCTHEYTLSNLRFARVIEPHNQVLANYEAHCQNLRAQNRITLPSSMGQELQINPFLRSRQPNVVQAAQSSQPAAQDALDDLGVFTVLREWKNNFK